jgi:dihydrofolate synthase / folylpolyglutamate synthase
MSTHTSLSPLIIQPNIPVIHVAGTNGKGSVALKIAKTLELSNPSLKVGLFCSPHVSSFRERMQINGQLISEDEVVEHLPHIYDICEMRDIPATFFEITTALAFVFFRNADVVVLETGLGGRLDATNILVAPALSIITSIGLEHTRILGETIPEIAREKGGIIKKDRPVLVGPNVPHDVLRAQAMEKGAEGYYTCEDLLGPLTATITDYDKENARIAKAALILLERSYPDVVRDVTPANIEEGTSTRPPCRFELVERSDGVTVVLDVAHNPPAMEYLLRKLKDTFPNRKYRIVVGMSSDKDLGLCANMLLHETPAESLHLVQAFHPRAAKLEHMLDAEPRLLRAHYDLEDRSITQQLQKALVLAHSANEVLVVCGSVFLMTEAREALGFDEPRDSRYIAEVAGAHLRHGQEIFANTDPEKPNASSG